MAGRGRRATDREPNRGWLPAIAIGAGVAILDWAVKAWVIATVPVGGFVEIWAGRVALWHVQNDAMILGLYGDMPLVARKVIAILAAILGILLLYEVIGRGHRLPRTQRPWAWLFVGLVLGGMAGNLGERAIHWAVTDYLSFAWGEIWLPPGNVADIALFCAVPLAVVVAIFELRARARRGSTPESSSTAPAGGFRGRSAILETSDDLP